MTLTDSLNSLEIRKVPVEIKEAKCRPVRSIDSWLARERHAAISNDHSLAD